MNYGLYEQAVKSYQEFFTFNPELTAENDLRIGLSYALSLGKSGNKLRQVCY